MPAAILIGGVFLVILLATQYKSSNDTSAVATTEDVTVSYAQPPATPLPQKPITSDPASWPSGDRIWDICRAIAIAEGYNVAGSNPQRLNNPGDISDGYSTFGGEPHSGSNVTKFPDAATGWTWLYNKIRNIANGASHSYDPSWTWERFAQTYAGDWQNWVNNVTAYLGVDPSSTFADYVAGNV